MPLSAGPIRSRATLLNAQSGMPARAGLPSYDSAHEQCERLDVPRDPSEASAPTGHLLIRLPSFTLS